jgi:AraC-like DNA-binding protein
MNTFHDVVREHPFLPFIREAGYAVREPWLLPERRLLDFLLIYVHEGILAVYTNGNSYLFTEGEFCLLQPNDLHTLEGKIKTITPFVHFDVFYNAFREESFPTRAGQTDLSNYEHLKQPRLNDLAGIHIPVKFVPPRSSVFRDKLLKLIGLWSEGDLINQLEANQLLSDLLLSVLKEMTTFKLPKYHKPQSLNWITSYFSFHLADPLSIEIMAQRAQLSSSRFSAVFKKHFGVSPYQYLLHLRITHAQELLLNSDYTLVEIAGFCGFADVHHFSKAFKKITNETPGIFRKNNIH